MKHFYLLLLFVFAFTANAQIQIGPVSPYTICQTPFTGFAAFNLQGYKPVVLGNLNPALYSVSFHILDPSVIPPGPVNPTLPALYINTVPVQTIYARVTEIANTDNFDTAQVLLVVEPQTIANTVANFFTCDTDNQNDGFSEINLTQFNNEIIGSQGPVSNYIVAYYISETDAISATNAIPFPNTYSTQSATLWAKISNSQYPNGCPAYISFEVNVERLPDPVIISINNIYTSCVDYINNSIIYRQVDLSTEYSAPYIFQWYKNSVAIQGAIYPDYHAIDSGSYTVAITGPAPLFCAGIISPPFEVIKSGPASLIGNGYTINGNDITVNAQGFGIYQYSLNADGPWQDSNIFTDVQGGGLNNNIYIRDNREPEGCSTNIISNVLSSNKEVLPRLTVYPNPASTVLTLQNASVITGITVYNTVGQQVLNKLVNSTDASVDVSAITNGVYFLKVQATDGQKTVRIVKE